MENLWKDRGRHICVLLVFSSVFLFGCQSTSPEEEDLELYQAESAEGCVEEDRGFNPCRINNNLPVCKND